MNAAEKTLNRIHTLSAFNVTGATRTKVNQHATAYAFPDGAKLVIYTTTQRGIATKGTAAHAERSVRVNATGR